jgi:hypothetical protein
MPKSNFLIKAEDYFFRNKDGANLTPDELDKIRRFEFVFTDWLDKPEMSEPDIVTLIINQFGLTRAQAYREMYEIRLILGSVNVAAKEFQRYRANQMINNGYKKVAEAKNKLEVEMGKGMIMGGKAMADVNRLNKLDPEEIPFDKIIPPSFEPSADISLLKLKNISPSNIRNRFAELDAEFNFFEDADIISDDTDGPE